LKDIPALCNAIRLGARKAELTPVENLSDISL